MSVTEQRRASNLTRVIAGELAPGEAAAHWGAPGAISGACWRGFGRRSKPAPTSVPKARTRGSWRLPLSVR